MKNQKFDIEIPAITAEQIDEQVRPVLRRMEEAGIEINIDALKKLEAKLSKKLVELEEAIVKAAGENFNIGSPSQLSEILFTKMKLPTDDLKRTKSGVSTAASELRKIENENLIIPLILEHRELSKLISTYLKPLPLLVDENRRLHTTYGLETSTGRLTSSEPNLQNIPIRGKYGKEIRAAFVVSPGMKLISADYSQIELRIVACLAKDKAMIEAFKQGIDIHTKTAAEIFDIPEKKVTADQRRIAKAVNFGIVYGQTPFGLSQALHIETQKAAEYILHYFDIHRGIKDYINKMIEKAHNDGFVETLFGMKRYLPNINSHMRYIAEGEERMAINTPVQGTAAELLKLAMIELDRKLRKKTSKDQYPTSIQQPNSNVHLDVERLNGGCGLEVGICPRMLLTVHDEIVVEAPAKDAEKIAKIVKETMENVLNLCVPIVAEVGIGENWAEAK